MISDALKDTDTLPNMTAFDVYFGLGSNIANALGTPIWHMRQAVHALAALHPNKLIQVSSLYKSAPMGPSDQPDYFNAVACVSFDEQMAAQYPPETLLTVTQGIEHAGQRDKKRHWGERSIDVDILLYGHVQVDTALLTIPHTGIFERNFVCVPLLELDETLVISGQALTSQVKARDMAGLECYQTHWFE